MAFFNIPLDVAPHANTVSNGKSKMINMYGLKYSKACQYQRVDIYMKLTTNSKL